MDLCDFVILVSIFVCVFKYKCDFSPTSIMHLHSSSNNLFMAAHNSQVPSLFMFHAGLQAVIFGQQIVLQLC